MRGNVMNNKELDKMTTVRVSRRTQHALNTIAGMLPKGTKLEDVIIDALKSKYPDLMAKIAELQQLPVGEEKETA